VKPKILRYFIISAGIILLITGASKLIASAGPAQVLAMNDSVLFLSNRHVLWITGVVELVALNFIYIESADNASQNINFVFSRGRGFGHAIPDMDIVAEIGKMDRAIDVHFASYATDASVLEAKGHKLTNLNLPENNAFVETLVASHRLITESKPDVIVAHEEFSAIVAARLTGVPSIFISAWLPPAGSIGAESLLSASSILVIDVPGLFPVPTGTTAHVHYSGPILRKMKYTWKDRLVLRRENGIPDEALAILVVPGGWASEERSPIVETVFSAYAMLTRAPKHLIWLAGKDTESIKQRAAASGLGGVTVLPHCDPIERVMAACDVVITKGTRGITMDATSVGVPSISLSPGLNSRG
jgi:hypothetical protein